MRVVILGGGISGLLAASVFRSHAPTILEAAPALGGTYLSGGLKYVRSTDAMRALLAELGVEFTGYWPLGGVYWDGPAIISFKELRENIERCRAAQAAHWLKTRCQGLNAPETQKMVEAIQPTTMNDPLGKGIDAALHFDHALFLHRLSAEAAEHGSVILGAKVAAVSADRQVHLGSGASYPYDLLINTLPLPASRALFPWVVIPPTPRSPPNTAAVLSGPPATLPMGIDVYDFIYTPSPTFPTVHRVSYDRQRGEWQAEAAGEATAEDIERATGVEVVSLNKIPGHLPTLSFQPSWPSTIEPLGRFAEWDARSTAETVLERAASLYLARV